MSKPRIDALFLALAALVVFPTSVVPAEQADPAEVEALVARAISLHKSGDILGAIDAYEVLLERAPERADARSNLGAAFVHLGRYEEAIDQYRIALAQAGRSPAIRFNLGLALYKAARFPEAATELAQVVELQPANKNAVLLLGECHLQSADNRRVIDLLSPFEESYAEDRAYAYLLGTALLREGEMERGQVWIDRVLSGGDSAEARLLMGEAHLSARDYPAAVEELSRAAELNPGLPTVHSLRGQALLATNDADGAEEAFRRELENNPNDFDANLYLGRLRKDYGRHDEARAYLTRALRLRDDDPGVLYALGSLYLATGDHQEACDALEGLVSQAPDFMPGHVLLAQVYYRLDRKEEGNREHAIVQRLHAERQARQREE
jgi:tetratricopeptide (TPR) repeat protein